MNNRFTRIKSSGIKDVVLLVFGLNKVIFDEVKDMANPLAPL